MAPRSTRNSPNLRSGGGSIGIPAASYARYFKTSARSLRGVTRGLRATDVPPGPRVRSAAYRLGCDMPAARLASFRRQPKQPVRACGALHLGVSSAGEIELELPADEAELSCVGRSGIERGAPPACQRHREDLGID